jgi:hypothetical protein
MRRTCHLVVLAAAIALVLPASALAAPDTIINFDGLANGTAITNQYAGVGVTFGRATDFGFPAPDHTCSTAYAATTGAISGTSAQINCATGPVEFPNRMFGAAFEFSTERRAVSFKLVQRTVTATQPATISAYAIGGVLLERRTVNLPKDIVVPVSFSRPTTSGGIVGIVISGPQLAYFETGGVFLDDIDATLDDVPPPQKFSLALATPSIDVVEGSIGQATISVRRYNGSTGPVTLSTGALPPGVAATQFSDNPVNGTNPTTLSITSAKPLSGQRQITVSASGGASAGTAIGASLVQTINGIPAITIASGGRSPLRLVPGCGAQEVNDSFNVRGGYTGSATVSITNPTGGLIARATTGFVPIRGDGVYPVKLSMDPGPADGGGTAQYGVVPSSATTAQLTLNWITDRVAVKSLPSATVNRPLSDGGSTLDVIGNFPAGCPVTFRDAAGTVWPVQSRGTADVGGHSYDDYRLLVPAAGVSGPLRVLSPSGAELARTPRVDVREFRNVFALSQGNSGAGAKGSYIWDDFVRTFGDDDAYACFIVCVRDPIAIGYYKSFQSTVNSGGGLCVGYTVMAARFRGYGTAQRPSDYQPGATRAWQIFPTSDGTNVKRDVVRWFVAQNDKGFAKARDDASSLSAADERRRLHDLIGQAGAALVSIRQGGAGHSVLAYGIQDTATGGVRLSIYDPNVPYTTSEETSTAARASALSQSVITIDKDGNWSGTSLAWSGGNSTLRVIPQLPSSDASLPVNFSIASLLDASARAGAAPATVSAITVDGQQVLAPGGTPRAGSGVLLEAVDSGVAAEPRYRLSPGRRYDFSIRGVNRGSYTNGLLGLGSEATVTGAATKRGQIDHLVLEPGRSRLSFAVGGDRSPLTYDLVQRMSPKDTRTASIAMTGNRGDRDTASLSQGTLTLAHTGAPTTARITLGSVGSGLPGSVQTAPLRVGRGEQFKLTPRSWSDLTGGVRLTVSRGGRVIRSGLVTLQATPKVTLGAIHIKRRGNRLLVTGRVLKAGSAPLLVATVERVRAGRVLDRRTASRSRGVKRGAFSFAVAAGKTPRGVHLRVRVLLIDQSPGLPTARKQITL